MKPTREQQEVINHVSGNAVVLAVAGSGKTSTLIRRAHHLITTQAVPADRILITTFSQSAKEDLNTRCQENGVTGLEIRTLHSLANVIVSEAKKLGLTHAVIGKEGFSRHLFEQSRNELIASISQTERQQITDLKQMTFKDFGTYISLKKGRLQLPYLPAELPTDAQAKVKVSDDNSTYAMMFGHHDELRRREGLLDYDDVIVTAWMLMQQYPMLSQLMRGRYWHVMVDEYQDVSTAQAEMLASFVDGTHSYMVAGDDDQAIYGWRGADPSQILDFATRYQAVCYRLPHNFRSPMGIVTLAQRVIEKNTVRAEKSMLATRAGNGVSIQGTAKPADIIMAALDEGIKPDEIAVLVRTYAQTPDIEQGLMERDIPYQVIGEAPFYQRPEARTLLYYVEIALADWDVQNGRPISANRRRRLKNLWTDISNRPGRYFRTTHIEQIADRAWGAECTLAQALVDAAPTWPKHVGKTALELSAALEFLTENIGNYPGKNILLQFTRAIQYAEFLIRTAPTSEFGRERANIIEALAEMAQSRSLGNLITHIADFKQHASYQEKYRHQEPDETPKVTLMSVYRAKGLQWPVVVIPDCTADLYRLKSDMPSTEREEERRVFYVGLTRATDEVHVLTAERQATRFLTDVDYERIISDHSRLARLLDESRQRRWSAVETIAASELIATYGHIPFIQNWLEPEQRRRIVGWIAGLENRLYHLEANVPDALFTPWYAAHGSVDFSDEDTVFDDIEQVLQPSEVEIPAAAVPEEDSNALGRICSAEVEFRVGNRVGHASFGIGEILAVERIGGNQIVQVRFADGNRRLATEYTRLKLL